MEINDWAGVIALAVSSLEFIRSQKNIKKTYAREALNEVIEASERTKSYQEQLRHGQDRKLSIESELAEKWSTVAFMMSDLDEAFSEKLSVKSLFWRNRETWTDELRAYRDISLDSVIRDAKIIKAKLA